VPDAQASRKRKTRDQDVAFSQLTLVLAHLEDFQVYLRILK
jgi:hypothetical protein